MTGFLERTNTLPGKIATVQKRWKLSTATLFLLCNLISSSSETAGAATPTMPGLGLFLSLVLYWELLLCLNSAEDMKPTAIWQATQTGANFCSLLIYLPVALCAAQDIITACSGDAQCVFLELGWCWLMGSSSDIWAGHSWPQQAQLLGCDMDRPQGQDFPWLLHPWVREEHWRDLHSRYSFGCPDWWGTSGADVQKPFHQLPGCTREQECWKWWCAVAHALWSGLWEGRCKLGWLRVAWKLNPV